jgi:hypothetical protein
MSSVHFRQPLSSPDQRSPAVSFAYGRLPAGDLRLCPRGAFEALAETDPRIRQASEAILQASKGMTDPAGVWSLMDESLRSAYGSFDEFRTVLEAQAMDAVWREWNFDGGAPDAEPMHAPTSRLLSGPIGMSCGNEVLQATWVDTVYFPNAQGLSAGSALLLFVVREDGPRLWATY